MQVPERKEKINPKEYQQYLQLRKSGWQRKKNLNKI